MSEFSHDTDREVIYKKRNTKRRKKRKKKIYNFLIALLCLVLVICLVNIGSYFWQDFSNDNMIDDLAGEVVSYDEASSPDSSGGEGGSGGSGGSGGGGSKKEVKVPDSINFESLKAQNKDVVGWIFSKNGVINYPILQGKDNSYYLNHLINGKKNINGSIFMDYKARSDFSGANTVVFGHSMDNGSMFRTLLNYKKQSYYEKYPEMYLFTPQGKYKLVIFAAYETNSKDLVYGKVYGEAGFKKLVSHAQSKSKIKAEVEVATGDRIVSLSTCAYSSNDARFIVMGKLVPADSEESENSTSSEVSSGYYGSVFGG